MRFHFGATFWVVFQYVHQINLLSRDNANTYI